jgi:NADH:ubiquinone reductase (non-electrogenic)
MKKLVILGTGFAAFSFLKKVKRNYFDITVVSPRNHFLFTPLLPSTTVGTIEFRSIIEPIRNIKNIKFFQAECTSIDIVKNQLECRDVDTNRIFSLPFELLLLCVGEITNSFNIEGVQEFAFYLKEVSDSRKIRVKVIDCFENASIPGLSTDEKKNFLRFVVCGGGPTGVEFAAELHDFIEEDVKKKYPEIARLTEIILIEVGKKLLNSFDVKLSDYTMRLFKRQNIIIKTNSVIQKVTGNSIYLNDGTELNYGLLVWATGNTSSKLVKQSSFPKTIHGKILVDDFFKVKSYTDIYALGDCAELESGALPVTAQVAQQQGIYLGKTFNKLATNKTVKPFKFHDLGMLAYVGERKALADMPQIKSTGFKTYIFWRSVYVTKLVSLKNKMLVLFDWFKTFMFGRDVSNF